MTCILRNRVAIICATLALNCLLASSKRLSLSYPEPPVQETYPDSSDIDPELIDLAQEDNNDVVDLAADVLDKAEPPASDVEAEFKAIDMAWKPYNDIIESVELYLAEEVEFID